jgi:hypothetical protein
VRRSAVSFLLRAPPQKKRRHEDGIICAHSRGSIAFNRFDSTCVCDGEPSADHPHYSASAFAHAISRRRVRRRATAWLCN